MQQINQCECGTIFVLDSLYDNMNRDQCMDCESLEMRYANGEFD